MRSPRPPRRRRWRRRAAPAWPRRAAPRSTLSMGHPRTSTFGVRQTTHPASYLVVRPPRTRLLPLAAAHPPTPTISISTPNHAHPPPPPPGSRHPLQTLRRPRRRSCCASSASSRTFTSARGSRRTCRSVPWRCRPAAPHFSPSSAKLRLVVPQRAATEHDHENGISTDAGHRASTSASTANTSPNPTNNEPTTTIPT